MLDTSQYDSNVPINFEPESVKTVGQLGSADTESPHLTDMTKLFLHSFYNKKPSINLGPRNTGAGVKSFVPTKCVKKQTKSKEVCLYIHKSV